MTATKKTEAIKPSEEVEEESTPDVAPGPDTTTPEESTPSPVRPAKRDTSVEVTFTRAYTDWDGQEHEAGSTASLRRLEAREVTLIGHARYADAPTAAATANTEGEGR